MIVVATSETAAYPTRDASGNHDTTLANLEECWSLLAYQQLIIRCLRIDSETAVTVS